MYDHLYCHVSKPNLVEEHKVESPDSFSEGRELNLQYQEYLDNGYIHFERDESVLAWVESSITTARLAVADKENQHWFRYGNTWFVGVNVLNNDENGRVSGGPPLLGKAVGFIESFSTTRKLSLDRAQISVCYEGYPQPSSLETDAAYGYRLRRDAAHVDGIMREGKDRYLVEYHHYIFALPMVECSHDAAPFVVWRGSHRIIQKALIAYLADYPSEQWRSVPISEVYNQARKEVFASCDRIEFDLNPGQAFVGHRHLLHGTAPWGASAEAGPDGRMICFFRPENLPLEQWVLGNGF